MRETFELSTRAIKNKLSPDALRNTITTLIAKTAIFRGDFLLQESVHVAGQVFGNILIEGAEMMLSVKEGAKIEGDVQADLVVVSGTITGSITAKYLRITSTANVDGEISYERIFIEEGASVNSSKLTNMSGQVIVSVPKIEGTES